MTHVDVWQKLMQYYRTIALELKINKISYQRKRGMQEGKGSRTGLVNATNYNRLDKAMVFPAVMYGYEGWTIKKAECQRIDAFEL